MGLIFAPGLPPLLLSLRYLVLEAWVSGAIVLKGFLSFSLWYPSNFLLEVNWVRSCKRGFNTGEGGE
jgi:hypothetical protein